MSNNQWERQVSLQHDACCMNAKEIEKTTMKKSVGRVGSRGALAMVMCTAFYAASANADITLIKKGEGDSITKNFELSVGGDAEVGFQNAMGPSDHGYPANVPKRGWADDSNYHVAATYFLPNDWKVIGYYELAASWFKAIGLKRHSYQNRDGNDDTYTRQLFIGVSNPDFGTLTYGQQNNVYYDLVGKKTDIWVNDMGAQGASDGVDGQGNFDGSRRAKDLLKYHRQVGEVTLEGSWALPSRDYYINANNVQRYTRKGGFGLAASWQITPELDWGTGYSYMRYNLHPFSGDTSSSNQQMVGTALSWKPGNWTVAGLAGYYKNFIPDTKVVNPDTYFSHDAHGFEYYVGYDFHLNNPVVRVLKPYFAGDALHANNFSYNDQFIGLAATLPAGFKATLEHQFSHVSGLDKDDRPDATHLRFEYVF